MESVFLDIDGTLWDSTAVVAKAWNQILEGRQDIAFRATSEKLRSLFGRTLYDIASLIFPELEPDKQRELIDQCCEREHDYLTVYPGKIFEGVTETIKELAKTYKICIVSNCQAGYIELVMSSLGIAEWITDFECPGYSGKGKAENITTVMKRNGLHRVIYVGDTEGDLKACRQAGIPFIYCRYGFGRPLEWDYAIDNFSQLADLMKTLS